MQSYELSLSLVHFVFLLRGRGSQGAKGKEQRAECENGVELSSLVQALEPNTVKYGSIIVDEELEVTLLGEHMIAPGIGLSISNSKTFTRINVTSEAQNFKAIVDVVSPPFDKVC